MVAPSKKVKVLTAKVEAEDQEPAMCTEPETKAKLESHLKVAKAHADLLNFFAQCD